MALPRTFWSWSSYLGTGGSGGGDDGDNVDDDDDDIDDDGDSIDDDGDAPMMMMVLKIMILLTVNVANIVIKLGHRWCSS